MIRLFLLASLATTALTHGITEVQVGNATNDNTTATGIMITKLKILLESNCTKDEMCTKNETINKMAVNSTENILTLVGPNCTKLYRCLRNMTKEDRISVCNFGEMLVMINAYQNPQPAVSTELRYMLGKQCSSFDECTRNMTNNTAEGASAMLRKHRINNIYDNKTGDLVISINITMPPINLTGHPWAERAKTFLSGSAPSMVPLLNGTLVTKLEPLNITLKNLTTRLSNPSEGRYSVELHVTCLQMLVHFNLTNEQNISKVIPMALSSENVTLNMTVDMAMEKGFLKVVNCTGALRRDSFNIGTTSRELTMLMPIVKMMLQGQTPEFLGQMICQRSMPRINKMLESKKTSNTIQDVIRANNMRMTENESPIQSYQHQQQHNGQPQSHPMHMIPHAKHHHHQHHHH